MLKKVNRRCREDPRVVAVVLVQQGEIATDRDVHDKHTHTHGGDLERDQTREHHPPTLPPTTDAFLNPPPERRPIIGRQVAGGACTAAAKTPNGERSSLAGSPARQAEKRRQRSQGVDGV